MAAAMAWNDSFLLGLPAMDGTHREFVECVAALQQALDTELPGRLEDFERHAVAHFGQEQQWMDGSAFPAAQCHADEHAAVLASVREVQGLLAQGANPQVARDLAQALVDWFPGHADYMDASLSQWMSKRAHGGAPVVLRRNVAKSASDLSTQQE
ncbi:MAG: hemerythrin-like metal-binding domain protein [Polaromonas sp.]|jgi:hemerythrin|nr:hemerythrin-like metal-binding domain protein [Polaromonas sp.]